MDVDEANHSPNGKDNDIAPSTEVDPIIGSAAADSATARTSPSTVATVGTTSTNFDKTAPTTDVSEPRNTNGSPSASDSITSPNLDKDQPLRAVSGESNDSKGTWSEESLRQDMKGVPSFLTVNVVKYLRECSGHESWQHLVDVYLTFEKKTNVFGVSTFCYLSNQWLSNVLLPLIYRN